jgi:PAS domain S-box-containing protein
MQQSNSQFDKLIDSAAQSRYRDRSPVTETAMRRQRLEWLCLLCAASAIGFAFAWWQAVDVSPARRAQPLERQAMPFALGLAVLGAGAALLRRTRRRGDTLEQSEARFRTLIEEAPVAVAILRAGKFIYTNRRYNLLHGYADGEQLGGLPWRAMIAPASLAALAEQEAAINADAARELRFEAYGLGKGAALVPVLKATTRVALIDGPATLIFVQDISAQKRAEAHLLDARDAAEAANRGKAEFLANMSHEIRTPLNAILGLAYLLEQGAPNAEAQAMLFKIRGSGKSLLGIINDILDLSKIDAGQMTLERERFDAQHVLDSVAATMGVAVAAKPIALLVHPLPEGLEALAGDALRLEQILTNLASNAIKFTERGQVALSVAVLARSAGVVLLRFAVDDTGIGIAPALQQAVFAPFTQADSSTTRRYGGSGLGLTICKKLVGLMGGAIGVDSVAGGGSRFWFTLPFDLAAPAPPAPARAALRALIAHDDATALACLAATARSLGWQVGTAAANQGALAQALRDGAAPDLVLLDQDSAALAAALRAAPAHAQCALLVAASTFALPALAAANDAALVDAFLSKPVTASTLAGAAKAARARRGAPPAAPPRAPGSGGALAGIRLLVVDDSEINREVALSILRSEGAHVALAGDGQAAIDYLLAHPRDVDLVLMDVQMPVLDGIAACTYLRTLAQFDDLPIVALTAGAFQSQQDAARAAGMSHFITKPFDITQTIALIRRLHRAPAAGAAIDVAHGIALWDGMALYRQYLGKFAAAYGDAVPALRAALAGPAPHQAAALARTLAGAAASVALPEVARSALAAERALDGAAAPDAAERALDQLAAALALAVAQIAQLAP